MSPFTDRTTSRRRRGSALAVLIAFLTTVAIGVGAASPAGAATAEETELFDATNGARAAYGLPALQYDPAASTIAANWAAYMASTQTLAHNPYLSSQVSTTVTNAWTRLGENVGYGGTVSAIQSAFMSSSGHRANVLGDYNRVGVGAARDGRGTLWVTVVFVKGPSLEVPVSWYLRNAASAGAPDASLTYGMSTYRTLSCDWDGNGTDTIGVYVDGWWYLRNSNSAGPPDIVVPYGARGYQPVCGDWDGNGTDTIGVYTGGWWYLRNSNTAGAPDAAFAYGAAGYLPVVGDWDGNRTDTIGVYTGGNWYLRNVNSGGAPSVSLAYGTTGYQPVVGDWDGNGTDTIGVFTAGWWYLRNANSGGPPNVSMAYGAAGNRPIVGDWDGNRSSGVGVTVGG